MKPIKNINLNNLVSDITSKKAKFEVDPLDMGIAGIQQNLIKRLELEVPEYGDFAPVVEKYESKNPMMEFGDIKVVCSHVQNEAKTHRSLDIKVYDKPNLNEFVYTIAQGDKNVILDAVGNKSFFQICKNVALKVDEQLYNG